VTATSKKQFVENNNSHRLTLPQIQVKEPVKKATLRRTFDKCHAYHINSLSVNSDMETFISADDLRINMWNFERSDQCFNIVDIKPSNMEDLKEVITCAAYHPRHCNVFVYSSSRGLIKMCDMRINAHCDKVAKVFETVDSDRSFFSEITKSIADISFSRDGRYFVSRDYLTVKIWDILVERPLVSITVNDQLRPKLAELYDNEQIFDQFKCGFSNDSNYVISGEYSDTVHLFDWKAPELFRKEIKFEVTPNSNRITRPSYLNNFQKKVQHVAWNPISNMIALSSDHNVYLYSTPFSL